MNFLGNIISGQDIVNKDYVDDVACYYDVVDEAEAPDYSGPEAVEVDAMMSDTSVNPVQNKVVKAYADKIDKKADENAAAIQSNSTAIASQSETIASHSTAIEANEEAIRAANNSIASTTTDIANINEAMTALNATIATLESLVNSINEWKNLLGTKIEIDTDGNVRINTNLIVEGETASKE